MTHLDDDVAAYVDGQLPESAARAARRHVQECEQCRWAVTQQEALKRRVREAGGPPLPPGLAASLTRLPGADIAREPWHVRLRRARGVRTALALVGTSVAVLAAAYALGGPASEDDPVTPPYESYAAAFGAPSGSRVLTAASPIDDVQAARLTADGWPCHHTLAGDLRREHAAQDATTVALRYSNGTHRLDLFEQRGRLTPVAVRGFTSQRVAGAPVWVGAGDPTIVTWDADGVVYTIVTDAGWDRVARTVAELPTPADDAGPDVPERVGQGLVRMADWVRGAA